MVPRSVEKYFNEEHKKVFKEINQIFWKGFLRLQSSYKLFGIRFINGNYNNAINKLRQSAFMVVPSGPGLATIGKDQRYTKAVQNCDFAIPDSGYMVLLLRWLKGKKIRKFSGYVF